MVIFFKKKAVIYNNAESLILLVRFHYRLMIDDAYYQSSLCNYCCFWEES